MKYKLSPITTGTYRAKIIAADVYPFNDEKHDAHSCAAVAVMFNVITEQTNSSVTLEHLKQTFILKHTNSARQNRGQAKFYGLVKAAISPNHPIQDTKELVGCVVKIIVETNVSGENTITFVS